MSDLCPHGYPRTDEGCDEHLDSIDEMERYHAALRPIEIPGLRPTAVSIDLDGNRKVTGP